MLLIDALPRGDVPGTLYIIEPDLRALDPAEPEDATLETHGMNPMKVLAMVKAMGGQPKGLFVVGCEPENGAASEEIERMGPSEPVAGAVGQAVAMVESLVHKILAEQQAIAAP